jgi:hypothetical protein
LETRHVVVRLLHAKVLNLVLNESGSKGKHLYLPSRYNLPFEDVYLKTKDNVKIHAWFIRQKTGVLDLEAYNKTPTIIYFHGNAGNISHRLRNASELFREVKCNILLVEYRKKFTSILN